MSSRLLPESETEKIVKKKDRFIDDLLGKIVEARIRSVSSAYAQAGQKEQESEQNNKGGHDLLGIMVDAMLRGSKTMTKPQILRECRTMFAAGYHTSAHTITWVLLLLAHNTEWQAKAREEVRRVTDNTGVVDGHNADKLHTVSAYPDVHLFATFCYLAGLSSQFQDTLMAWIPVY